MSWHLEYTPSIWPAIVWTVSATVLAVYGWRRRSVPGAVPFVAAVVCAELWAVFSAFELASTDLAAKIFWAKVRSAMEPPTATVALWFALEYGDLRRWLVRRTFILLAAPPFLWLLLALTNESHHLLWSRYSFDGWVHPVRNAGGWILVGYTFALGLAMTCVLVWVFWRSPPHRVPVAFCLCGNLVLRAAYVLREATGTPAVPVDFVVMAFNFSGTMWAIALFRFRLFNLIPIARGTVIDQMCEGMLVLDAELRIMDLNPAAERILGVRATHARGGRPADFLSGFSLGETSEITLGAGNALRHYALRHSDLNDRRGHPVGTLVLLEDVTGQKEAQAQLLEQQRALATLHERDRVARELHDTLGQVLGYIKMQAAVAETFLDRGEPEEAKRRVARLATAAQDAQSDVREYILGAQTGVSAAAPLVPALSDYLRQFGENYGVTTELSVPPELAGQVFEPMATAQLLRIIQEALTNVRKHARARRVDVQIAAREGRAEVTVQDDGAGFDPAAVQPAGGQRFGLQVMRERAEEVGGAVQVHSVPGAGTQVVISVPLPSPAGGGC